MNKIMFGVAALLLALTVTNEAGAQGGNGNFRRPEILAVQPGQKTEWQAVSVTRDGKAMSAADAKSVRATADGSSFSLEIPGRKSMKGTYKINRNTSPAQMDVVVNGGPGKGAGVQMQGICELNGDTLKVCCAPPGQPRPTEFSSQPGSGNRMFVMKLVKNNGKAGRTKNPGTGK
jgi:uncharacterized protein (TIGR03067 family)